MTLVDGADFGGEHKATAHRFISKGILLQIKRGQDLCHATPQFLVDLEKTDYVSFSP